MTVPALHVQLIGCNEGHMSRVGSVVRILFATLRPLTETTQSVGLGYRHSSMTHNSPRRSAQRNSSIYGIQTDLGQSAVQC